MNYLNGYFALGGAQIPDDLPCFKKQYSGNHLNSRSRGQWVIDCDLTPVNMNIPSRDKQVQLFSDVDDNKFLDLMSSIDSEYEEKNYRGKLNLVQQQLASAFTGIVNNISTSTHGSLALITNDTPIHFFGLHDTGLNYSYLMWCTDYDYHRVILESQPLRFLLYRMPALVNSSIFLPGEVLCARWWRLSKNHGNNTLYGFNALERRLFGSAQI